MSIMIALISLIIALLQLPNILLQLPFTFSKWKKILYWKFPNYNHKEKMILASSVTALLLSLVLGGLAVAQFENSIPTLLYMQKQPTNSIPNGFTELMWFGILSGIICSLVGYYLFRINLKELRIFFG